MGPDWNMRQRRKRRRDSAAPKILGRASFTVTFLTVMARVWHKNRKECYPAMDCIQLLGIAQRTIHIAWQYVKPFRKPQKPFPTVIKTLGDPHPGQTVRDGLHAAATGVKIGD